MITTEQVFRIVEQAPIKALIGPRNSMWYVDGALEGPCCPLLYVMRETGYLNEHWDSVVQGIARARAAETMGTFKSAEEAEHYWSVLVDDDAVCERLSIEFLKALGVPLFAAEEARGDLIEAYDGARNRPKGKERFLIALKEWVA